MYNQLQIQLTILVNSSCWAVWLVNLVGDSLLISMELHGVPTDAPGGFRILDGDPVDLLETDGDS